MKLTSFLVLSQRAVPKYDYLFKREANTIEVSRRDGGNKNE